MERDRSRCSGEWPNVPVDVLIVEDNPADVRLMREALREDECESVHPVKDGREALDFLHGGDGFEGAPRPDLVLLDLNLPRVGGYDVLEEIKTDPELHHIPVVVFSSSDDQEDIERSYDLHANTYVTKPADLPSYMRAIHALEDYWLRIAHLPGQRPPTERGIDGRGA